MERLEICVGAAGAGWQQAARDSGIGRQGDAHTMETSAAAEGAL